MHAKTVVLAHNKPPCERLAFQQGACDLLQRRGGWYLLAAVPTPALTLPSDVLGVDSGIVNVISKRLVAQAHRTQRALALEVLQGIRTRIRAARLQRARLHTWAFGQLHAGVRYKAALAGVLAVWVDPRNTSRTCPAGAQRTGTPRRASAVWSAGTLAWPTTT